VNLIGSTKTSTGLRVKALLDMHTYTKGIRVPDEELESIHIVRDEFHGEWNYMITPYQE
jgi:Rhodopirellula transposase DDE domain